MTEAEHQGYRDQRESFSMLALELLDSGVVVINQSGKIILWNQWMANVSAISGQQALGHDINSVFDGKIKGRLIQAIDYALYKQLSSLLSSSLNRYTLPLYSQPTDSSAQPAEAIAQSITVKPLLNHHGDKYCLVHVANVTDVIKRETLLKQQGDDLKQLAHDKAVSEFRSLGIIENSLDCIMSFDQRGLVQNYNPAAAQMFALPSQMTKKLSFQSIVASLNSYSGLDIVNVIDSLGYTSSHVGTKWPEAIGVPTSGDTFPIEIAIISTEIDQRRLFTAVIRDISAQKETEQRLTQLARYDFLTGLANRAYLYERLELSISRVRRDKHPSALIFIDLDHFKTVNDTRGHSAGDELLKHVANCLTDVIRDVDLAARLGGDEFAIILENSGGKSQVGLAIERLCKSLATPLAIEGEEVTISCSMGICIIDETVTDCDELIKSADIAMYQAKSKGRNNYQFYSTELRQKSEIKLSLENALREATKTESLHLHYQPIVDIQNKRLAGIEALLRWDHPELGSIPPVRFIPLLEEIGLIGEVGEWVLKTACTQHKSWHDRGLVDENCTIAVNFSAKQFKDIETARMIDKILSESKLASELLNIELTESVLMASHRNPGEVLHELKKIGLRLSIDDFGTGYSSLSYLRKFPINNLKIDRSFIEDINNDNSTKAIVKTIIDLAHNLGLTVIAEGIEEPYALNFLKQHGCHLIQGYLIARPMSIEKFEDFCRAKNWQLESYDQSLLPNP